MHHALEIEEILLNIFGYCYIPPRKGHPHVKVDLAALARTCRTFKEPALDVLWSELADPSPLSRCLPEVSCQIPTADKMTYSFSRPLRQVEWDILRSYTCRIRVIWRLGSGLDWGSVSTFWNPPTDMLFPKLQHLYHAYVYESIPLLHLPLPALLTLTIGLLRQGSLYNFEKYPPPFPIFSPNIKDFTIFSRQPDVTFDKVVSEYICQWRNLQTVCCPDVALDMDVLTHLSRIPGFAELTFTTSVGSPNQTADPNSILLFSDLSFLCLYSGSLVLASRLLAHIRLPTITSLEVNFKAPPSKQDLGLFLEVVRTTCVGHSIRYLRLNQDPSGTPGPHILSFDDLEPIMVFSNLRYMFLTIEWEIGLADCRPWKLVEAWPHLEDLVVNNRWSWKRGGRIRARSS